MSLFEANLKALEAVRPGLGARLRGSSGPDRAQWSEARNGAATAVRDGRQLASRFDPQAEAEKAAPDWAPDTVFGVQIGLGLGYGAEALARKFPGLPLVIAEADPAWAAEVLAHRDLSGLWSSGSVFLVLGPDAGEVGRFLTEWEVPVLGLAFWRPGEAWSPGWTEAVLTQTEAAQVRGQANRATGRRFLGLWVRNWTRNQGRLAGCAPVVALRGTAAGLPVVIAAAGPSLADQLPWLRQFRDRFVLVAVDTAWNSLSAAGLVPDLLVVLDGQYWNARHVDRRPPEGVAVVTEACGPPRAFELAPGRTFVAASSVSLFRPLEQARWGALGNLPSGGSVATASWSLACLLGAASVILAGLDLGYPRGQTHVPGSQFEETVLRRADRLRPAETLGRRLLPAQGLSQRPSADGGLVLSDSRMDLFRRWLSEAIAAAPGLPVYNLGSRGSLVVGASSLPSGTAEAWAPARWSVPAGSGLVRRDARFAPSWAKFDALASDASDARRLQDAWDELRRWWGPAADQWAGRAWLTWVRFPTPAAAASLAELLVLAAQVRPAGESL